MAKSFVSPSSIMALKLIVLLTISSSLICLEARPLKVAKLEKLDTFISGIPNVKNEGPSPGGQGNKFTMIHALSGIKDSGPSPGGDGNGYIDGAFSKTIGGIKHSGPNHNNAPQILVSEIKHFDPSPSVITRVHVLSGIKDSGPSHGGDGNDYTDGAFSKIIGGTKYSSSIHGSSSQMLAAPIEEDGPSPDGPGN